MYTCVTSISFYRDASTRSLALQSLVLLLFSFHGKTVEMRLGKSLSVTAQDGVTIIPQAKWGKKPLPHLGICLLVNTV